MTLLGWLRPCLLAVFLASTAFSAKAAFSVEFHPLGYFDDTPLNESHDGFGLAVSNDGLVGGHIGSVVKDGGGAFLWSSDTGYTKFGEGAVTAVTADGKYAAGVLGTDPVRWTADGVVDHLEAKSGGIVWGLSADGSVAVGYEGLIGSSDDFHAVVWTFDDGHASARDLGHYIVYGVSSDGSTIAGNGDHGGYLWNLGSGAEPVVWTHTGGSIGISADGTTVIGGDVGGAVRWNAADGLTELGDLPGGSVLSSAWGVSGDGSVVVGESDRGDGSDVWFGTAAFIWDKVHGMRALQDVLTDKGLVLDGWYLAGARAISPNGRFIVGAAINPQGRPEPYLVDLGLPPITGDANGDGHVDLTDFAILKTNFGSGIDEAHGDFNGDGQVNLADFGILKAHFGTAAASVPEPSGFFLAAWGLAGLLAMYLRRRYR